MTLTYTDKRENLLIRLSILIPILIWAILQVLLYQRHQVTVPADAIFRYIPHAHKLAIEGYLDFGYDIRFVGYTVLIAAALKLGTPFIYIVVFQILLSFLAVVFIYKTIYSLTNNYFCAFMAALLLASCQDIQQWNYYLLTESVFTSVLVACAYIVTCLKGKARWLLTPLVIYASILRPNGFIIVASIFIFYFYLAYLKADKYHRRNLELGLLIMGAFLLLIANQLLSPFTIVETYARGEIIYGSPEYKIAPPATLKMPPKEALALQKIVLFFWENPVFALQQFFAKGLVFLAFIKPYFSLAHKVIIALTVYPCYFLIFQAFTLRTTRPYSLMFVSVIILQTLIVMATSEDWDCRFITPILPFVFMLGTLGLSQVLLKYQFPLQDFKRRLLGISQR
ncbi:hypothetical protein [Rufibacter soli]|jgi:hypothetical protein